MIFELSDESLPQRIDRFAAFVRALQAREPWRFPVAVMGYSMGGIVARGALRKHPDLTALISHVALLAVPNWGLRLSVVPKIAHMLGLPWRELYNIDPEHRFVPWLNGCDGRWITRGGKRIWAPDGEPWTHPSETKVLAMAGIMPKYRDGDGLVSVDSATMGGRIPHVTFRDKHANHLNVTGETDGIARLVRGFQRSDSIWPRVLDAFEAFVASPQTDAQATLQPVPHRDAPIGASR